VIDPEHRLQTIDGDGAFGCRHSAVVDEHVYFRMPLPKCVRKQEHGRERFEFDLLHLDGTIRPFVRNHAAVSASRVTLRAVMTTVAPGAAKPSVVL
jgi:hypothetical protein